MINKLKELNIGEVKENEDLKKYNTYNVSVKAAAVVFVSNVKSLIKLLKFLKYEKIKYKVIGNGSNLIFVNDYDGILIKLNNLDKLIINEEEVIVESGYNLSKLSLIAADKGLSGLEFSVGIPGSIGGAVYMNAGAYNKSMSDIIEYIEVIDENYKIKKLKNKDLNFDYRKSILKEKNYICIKVVLKLEKSNKKEIKELILDRQKRRKETQPLEYPNAGSVFRNPKDLYAGKLIEDLNLKGYHINDAFISEKHANFIINKGNASGKDIENLIKYIQKEVYSKYKINLILEQEIVK